MGLSIFLAGYIVFGTLLAGAYISLDDCPTIFAAVAVLFLWPIAVPIYIFQNR